MLDPLPATELHNLFQEFNSSIQPIVEKIPGGHRPDLLAALIPVREDGLKYVVDARPDMCVDWVLGVSHRYPAPEGFSSLRPGENMC